METKIYYGADIYGADSSLADDVVAYSYATPEDSFGMKKLLLVFVN